MNSSTHTGPDKNHELSEKIETKLISGKVVSEHLRGKIKDKILQLTSTFGRPPCLAVIIVGDNKASHVYVKNKEKACADVGMKSIRIDLPADCTQAQLEKVLLSQSQDSGVDGILVQLPLPKHLSESRISDLIPADKDADGFTCVSLGRLMADKTKVAPCTPAGVIELLKFYGIETEGKEAVVVGRSLIVGKPMAQLLIRENATVIQCHSKTTDLSRYTKKADIVVVAAGKREFLGKDDFKKNSVVIDVGIHGSGDGKSITGDVRYQELVGWVKAVTPVPGGVGPMTITMLLQNTLELMEQRLQK